VALHALLVATENESGRERGGRWGPRTLDLDLLLFGDLVIDRPELVVPHPPMVARRFVLEPAAEIAPDLLYPPTNWTIARLYDHLRHAPKYVALAGMPGSGKTALARQIVARTGALLLSDSSFDDSPAGRSSGPVRGSKLELADALERFAHRARLLVDSLSGETSATGSWRISDFWIPEAVAYVKSQLTFSDLLLSTAILERDLPVAKFTVWLDFDPPIVGQPWTERETLNVGLSQLLSPFVREPVLRLRPGDQPEPVEQVLAAMAAAE
jgi:hypothetical protein